MSGDRDQFIKTNFELLHDREFLKRNRCKYMLNLLIRESIVRRPFRGDLNLYKDHWKKGYLSASRPTRYLAECFGYKSTCLIRKWIKELEEEKAFILEKIHVGRGKPQHLFIFGIHNSLSDKEYEEYFYIDHPELIVTYGMNNTDGFRKLLESSALKGAK